VCVVVGIPCTRPNLDFGNFVRTTGSGAQNCPDQRIWPFQRLKMAPVSANRLGSLTENIIKLKDNIRN
jgi:hypothetical protein